MIGLDVCPDTSGFYEANGLGGSAKSWPQNAGPQAGREKRFDGLHTPVAKLAVAIRRAALGLMFNRVGDVAGRQIPPQVFRTVVVSISVSVADNVQIGWFRPQERFRDGPVNRDARLALCARLVKPDNRISRVVAVLKNARISAMQAFNAAVTRRFVKTAEAWDWTPNFLLGVRHGHCL